MRIHKSNATSVKAVALNKIHHFSVGGFEGERQLPETPENDVTLPQCSKGNFSDDEGVHKHVAIGEQFEHDIITMI